MTCPALGAILTGTLAGLGVLLILSPLIYAAGRTKGMREKEACEECGVYRGEIE